VSHQGLDASALSSSPSSPSHRLNSVPAASTASIVLRPLRFLDHVALAEWSGTGPSAAPLLAAERGACCRRCSPHRRHRHRARRRAAVLATPNILATRCRRCSTSRTVLHPQRRDYFSLSAQPSPLLHTWSWRLRAVLLCGPSSCSACSSSARRDGRVARTPAGRQPSTCSVVVICSWSARRVKTIRRGRAGAACRSCSRGCLGSVASAISCDLPQRLHDRLLRHGHTASTARRCGHRRRLTLERGSAGVVHPADLCLPGGWPARRTVATTSDPRLRLQWRLHGGQLVPAPSSSLRHAPRSLVCASWSCHRAAVGRISYACTSGTGRCCWS